MVQVCRTSSNLLKLYHCRDSKVCRVLSHEFWVVRLYRTFSNYIFTGEARCAECLCTSSGWFKYMKLRRTFSNHIIAEIAICVEFYTFFHRDLEILHKRYQAKFVNFQNAYGKFFYQKLCQFLLPDTTLFDNQYQSKIKFSTWCNVHRVGHSR